MGVHLVGQSANGLLEALIGRLLAGSLQRLSDCECAGQQQQRAGQGPAPAQTEASLISCQHKLEIDRTKSPNKHSRSYKWPNNLCRSIPPLFQLFSVLDMEGNDWPPLHLLRERSSHSVSCLRMKMTAPSPKGARMPRARHACRSSSSDRASMPSRLISLSSRLIWSRCARRRVTCRRPPAHSGSIMSSCKGRPFRKHIINLASCTCKRSNGEQPKESLCLELLVL